MLFKKDTILQTLEGEELSGVYYTPPPTPTFNLRPFRPFHYFDKRPFDISNIKRRLFERLINVSNK